MFCIRLLNWDMETSKFHRGRVPKNTNFRNQEPVSTNSTLLGSKTETSISQLKSLYPSSRTVLVDTKDSSGIIK